MSILSITARQLARDDIDTVVTAVESGDYGELTEVELTELKRLLISELSDRLDQVQPW